MPTTLARPVPDRMIRLDLIGSGNPA